MNVLVTYSSLTGNTKKLAEGIFDALSTQHKELQPICDVTNTDAYDIVLVGYWVDKEGPNEEAATFLKGLTNKTVGLFATLGYWADSEHAQDSLKKGEQLLDDTNKLLARFICQGKLSDNIISAFKKMPADSFHALTPEKLRRYEIAAKHPSVADISWAGELFEERIQSLCLKSA